MGCAEQVKPFQEQGGLQALLNAAGRHYVEAQLWSD